MLALSSSCWSEPDGAAGRDEGAPSEATSLAPRTRPATAAARWVAVVSSAMLVKLEPLESELRLWRVGESGGVPWSGRLRADGGFGDRLIH